MARQAVFRFARTQRHVDCRGKVIFHVNGLRSKIRGMRMTHAPEVLRHLTARFEPIGGALIG